MSLKTCMTFSFLWNMKDVGNSFGDHWIPLYGKKHISQNTFEATVSNVYAYGISCYLIFHVLSFIENYISGICIMNEKDVYSEAIQRETWCLQRENFKAARNQMEKKNLEGLEGLYWINTSPLLLSYSLIHIFCRSGPMGSNERGCLKQEWWEQLYELQWEPIHTDVALIWRY